MKKILLLSFFIFSFSFTKAQWVTIPDANFVAWLQTNYPTCMNGNQINTSCSLILNDTSVECSSQNISDLTGIQYFSSLLTLNCSFNQLTSLPVLPNSLINLDCSHNFYLTSLPSLPNSLTTLNCYDNSLSSLPSLPNSLTHLDCSYNNSITNLPSLPNSLNYLDCSSNLLTNLPSLPSSLTELIFKDNSINGLLTLPGTLTYLDCRNNPLMNLPTLPNTLDVLACSNTSLTVLPILPGSLSLLNCDLNSLTSLPPLPITLGQLICDNNLLTTLPTLPNSLTYLYCENNLITSLPLLPNSLHAVRCGNNLLSNLPSLPNSLYELKCNNNALTSLPVLPASFWKFNISNNPGIVCLPQFQSFTGNSFDFNISNTGITCLPNTIQHTGYIAQIDTMPICDVLNTNGCEIGWNINGTIVLDGDSSCVTTNDGTGIQPIKINLFDVGSNLVQQVISNWGGDFSFDTQLGNYSTSVDTANIPFNVLCPISNSIASSLTAIDSMDWNVDFRLACKSGFDIGAWNILRHHRFFPNDITLVHVIAGDVTQSIYNVSCNSGISGEVKVVINGLADYGSPLATALTPTVVGDTLIYSIPDFSLVNSNTDFAFYVITGSTAQIGDQICFDVTVTPTIGDNNVSNNTLTHCFAVSNSYDPNEKEVSPVGNLTYPFNDCLTYTIHFQNTGTAPAQHIQILDTLDADLEASTFQLLSYSHAPMVQLFGSKVHFNFVNINLPDSTTDFEGSKGYVSYRVKPLANLPLGTTIENTASIYFDFNTPVVTNTVSNVICNPIAPTNLSETICAGDSYNFNGTNISTAGNYSVTLNAVNGCDSVVNLNFTVDTVNTDISWTENAASAQAVGAIYQWLDCNNNYSLIPGATNQNYIASGAVTVAVLVTQNGCTDTSNCIYIDGVEELTIDLSQFSVFPNPADENITVTLSQPCENCKIEISNTLGQILYQQIKNDRVERINLAALPAGIYFIALRSDKMSVVKKLVKD